MSEKLYSERDVMALGAHFVRHMMAMTAEDLHGKGEIAAELAWRDAEIERLKAELVEAEAKGRRDALLEIMKPVRQLRSGECWCAFGIGHPLMTAHSEPCKAIRKLSESARTVQINQGGQN